MELSRDCRIYHFRATCESSRSRSNFAVGEMDTRSLHRRERKAAWPRKARMDCFVMSVDEKQSVGGPEAGMASHLSNTNRSGAAPWAPPPRNCAVVPPVDGLPGFAARVVQVLRPGIHQEYLQMMVRNCSVTEYSPPIRAIAAPRTTILTNFFQELRFPLSGYDVFDCDQ
jgi:hypothetical protein